MEPKGEWQKYLNILHAVTLLQSPDEKQIKEPGNLIANLPEISVHTGNKCALKTEGLYGTGRYSHLCMNYDIKMSEGLLC